MNSVFNTNTHEFYQEEYDNNFYYCDIGHPFIAFTTCYCPLCEKIEQCRDLIKDSLETTDAYDKAVEDYLELVAKANSMAPEILV